MSEYEITVKDGQIVVTDEVLGILEQARALDRTIKELKAKKDAIEKSLKAAMTKNNIDSFKCDVMTVSKTKDYMKATINEERMKSDGIYEKYLMYLPTSGSMRITYRKEKNNG